MTERPRTTPEADLAFLRAIVEGGASGRGMLTMGVAYFAGGVLYGLQCLFHIAQMHGRILWPAGPSLAFIVGVSVVFCAILTWAVREDRKHKVARGPLATRTMNAAFTATGMVNLAVIVIFGIGSARDQDFAIWLYYPAIIFAAQAAAWFVAWSLKRRPWMLATAAGGWITAVTLGLLVRQSDVYLYVCTAALFLLFALPGWIMIRGALQTRAAD
jgi:hypothetical protein